MLTALTHKRMVISGLKRRRARCLPLVKLKRLKRNSSMRELFQNEPRKRQDAMTSRRKSLRN
jgi:hypothetical protein